MAKVQLQPDDSKAELTTKNVSIEHKGDKIILPIINGTPMKPSEARHWLLRKEEEEERDNAVHYELKCSPMDGAVAFMRAISEKYGFSEGVPTPGFFGSTPPYMLGVNISPTEKINVPWGRIQIQGIEGYLTTGMKEEPQPMFTVGGVVKKKHAENVRELVALTEKYVKEHSIYKGKAVKVDFAYSRDPNRSYDPMQDSPQFMDLKNITVDDLIFGEAVKASLNIGLFTPIEHSAACREHQVPLKRGILLHGPYGTGKTMTAYVTAVKAVEHDWTFIYLNDVTDLKMGLAFAAQYAPAVIFAEDIDRVVTGKRSVDIDGILNTLDGVDTKGCEIITVLTTNHLENINSAMLRPGRLDTLVEVTPPDAGAAQKLVLLYARDLLEETADLSAVGEALQGKIPALIREVVERSKIAAISRTGSADIRGKVLGQDILDSAMAMENHASLLAPKEADNKPKHEFFVVEGGTPQVQEATSKLKKAAG